MRKLLLWLMLLVGTAWGEPPHVRALLIGINHYRDPVWRGASGQGLKGCLQDVASMEQALRRWSGDPHPSITRLPQEQATRAGLERALARLVEEARPGEAIVIHYSGHGAVVPDDNGDAEQDGLDECLVPVDCPDYRAPAYPQSVLRDDAVEATVAALLRKVRSGGANGTVVGIFDSCHSGGISRGALASGPSVRSARGVRDHFLQKRPGTRPVLHRPHLAGPGWVILSACRSDEEARDAPEGGYLTQALVAALADPRLHAGGLTYDELFSLVRTSALFGRGGQSPQLNGYGELLVFGSGSRLPREPLISVVGAQGPRLTLSQGQLSGLTPGSRLALYPPGTVHPEPSSRLAEAVVETAGTSEYRAIARVEGSPAANLEHAVAFLTRSSFGSLEVGVYCDPAAQELAARLASGKIPLARPAERSQADLVLLEEHGRLTLERPDQAASPVVWSGASGDPRLEANFGEAVEREARRLFLARLKTPRQDLRVSLIFGRFSADDRSFVADPEKAQKARRAPDGRLSARGGDESVLRITNQGRQPLYISVLNLDGRGGIDVHYPQPVEAGSWEPLPAGGSVDIGTDFAWPEGTSSPSVIEGFKVFGTDKPVDLRFLATRGGSRASLTPDQGMGDALAQLMESFFSGTRASHPELVGPERYVVTPELQVRVVR